MDGYEFGDDYIVRNGRKMVHGSPPGSVRQSSMGAPTSARSAAQYNDNVPAMPGPPLTPGGSIGRTQPLRRPQHSQDGPQRYDRNDDTNTQLENLEAQEVMRREVYGPHDALDLLYKAATDSPGHNRTGRSSNGQMSPMIGNNMSREQPSPIRPQSQHFQNNHMRPPDVPRDPAIDPALSAALPQSEDRTQEQGYKDAVKAWARFRFVRAGWFTPAEAIAYID